MSENDKTYKLIKSLNKLPLVRAKKRHGGKFQSGEPDIVGSSQGLMFVMEAKVQGGRLTRLQALELDRWRYAGVWTAVICYLDSKVISVLLPLRSGAVSWEHVAERDLGGDAAGFTRLFCSYEPHEWADVLPSRGLPS